MSIDLLLLAVFVFGGLLLDLALQREEHLVAIGFVLNLLLLDQLCVFEFKQLLLGLEEGAHLCLLLV